MAWPAFATVFIQIKSVEMTFDGLSTLLRLFFQEFQKRFVTLSFHFVFGNEAQGRVVSPKSV